MKNLRMLIRAIFLSLFWNAEILIYEAPRATANYAENIVYLFSFLAHEYRESLIVLLNYRINIIFLYVRI